MGRRGIALLVALGLVVIGACGARSKAAVPRRGPQLYEGSFRVLSEPGKPANLCHVIATSLPPQCDGLPVVGWNWDAVSDEESRNGTTWGGWHVVGTYTSRRFTLVGMPTPPQSARPDTKRDFSPACDDPEVVDASEGVREWEAMTQVSGFEIQHLVAASVSDPRGEWDDPFVGNVVVLPGAKAAAVALVRRHYAGALCLVERDGPTEAQLEKVQQQLHDRDARAAIGTVQSSSSDARRGVVVADIWLADRAALTYARDRWGKLVELHGLLQPVPSTG